MKDKPKPKPEGYLEYECCNPTCKAKYSIALRTSILCPCCQIKRCIFKNEITLLGVKYKLTKIDEEVKI